MADYALALHTSSPDLGLAIASLTGSQPFRSQVWPLGRDLSRDLHIHLQAFLQPHSWQDLAWIAVAIGPGGFTGTRMGVVTARTLAQQLQIPLFGVSSLAAIATSQVFSPGVEIGDQLAIAMPAQRGEVFASLYQVQATATGDRYCQPVLPDSVLTLADWQQKLATQCSSRDRIYHTPTVPSSQGQHVEQVLAIAAQAWNEGQRPDWSAVLPFYGQHPVTK